MNSMKQFSIGLLMAIVLLFATDLAIVRAFWNRGTGFVSLALITLPMINLLLLTLRRSRGPQGERLFWLAFQAAGWGMILLSSACILFFPDSFLFPVTWVCNRCGPGPLSLATLAFLFAFPVVFYTSPQLIIATVTGMLATRYRVVIERRPAPILDPEGEHVVPGEAG